MNFSQRQADPRRHLVGITFVIMSHGPAPGRSSKRVDADRATIEAQFIEEAFR